MYIVPLKNDDIDASSIHISKGDAYKHIPRTSTIATSATEDSKCSKFGV